MRQLLPGIKTYDAKSCVADPILYIASKFRPYGSDCFRCHDAAALSCVARRRGIPHRRRAAAPTWSLNAGARIARHQQRHLPSSR